jgi:hypothetical protein
LVCEAGARQNCQDICYAILCRVSLLGRIRIFSSPALTD